MEKWYKWTAKDYMGLSVIPIEFLVGTLLGKLSLMQTNKILAVCVTVGLFFIGFLVMIFLFKEFLAEQWQKYKQRLWIKLLINALLVVGAFAILNFSRKLLPASMASAATTDEMSSLSLTLMLLAAVTPFLAPFAEELTFRYLLFGKIKGKGLKILMFFVSSILFGLIHWNNFNGDWVATIPYMVVGAYFALIYYFFDNIWGSIFVHWLFNSLNSIIPALFLVIMKILGAI